MSQVTGFRRSQIWLHWIIAVLIGAQYITSAGIDDLEKVTQSGAPADTSSALPHMIIGSTVLVLGIIRLVMRLRYGAPPPPEEEHPVLRLLAKLSHLALYVLIFIIPVSGMVGWLTDADAPKEAHEAMTGLLMLLVAIHAAAALFHHFVLKTDVLRRMSLRR